jgi:hypothetical protein
MWIIAFTQVPAQVQGLQLHPCTQRQHYHQQQVHLQVPAHHQQQHLGEQAANCRITVWSVLLRCCLLTSSGIVQPLLLGAPTQSP